MIKVSSQKLSSDNAEKDVHTLCIEFFDDDGVKYYEVNCHMCIVIDEFTGRAGFAITPMSYDVIESLWVIFDRYTQDIINQKLRDLGRDTFEPTEGGETRISDADIDWGITASLDYKCPYCG